jgi:glycosyltransferase involved in cell wall biosynthesis
MNNLVSICIPTYNRPTLLQKTLESCFVQNYTAIEIIVGDDSEDNETETLISHLKKTYGERLRYFHNIPHLGQSENINRLFNIAQGDRLVLLHDDDLILPNAIANLARCWDIIPDLTAAYGKQYIINMQGGILEEQSDILNRNYYRTSDKAGVQELTLFSGLVQQFPNDGYMVLSSFARRIPWRTKDEVGNGCEFDFGLRLSLAAHKFYFLDQYTAKYRITDVSMSGSFDDDALAQRYKIVCSLSVPNEIKPAREKILRDIAVPVTSYYLNHGNRKEALKIYLSEYYPKNNRFSFRGIYHLLLFLLPIKLILNIHRIKRKYNYIEISRDSEIDI